MPISKVLAAAGAALISSAVATTAVADITILAWPGGPAEEALRKVVAKYNETSDSKAELLYFSRDSFFDKMLADSAAGSKEFDVMLTATYQVGKYAPFMTPINDLITDDVMTVFPQSAIDSQSYEGDVYGIPTDLGVHFVYYRTDLIDELLGNDDWKAKYAEISQEYMGKAMEPKMPADWTWDDFIASALFFTQSINPDSPVRYGTVLQMKNLLFNIMVWQGSVASYGGNWMDDEGNITVDSDAYRTGLDIFKKIVDAEATPGDSNSYEYAEANGAFGTGQVAFFIQWSAAYAEFIDPEQYPAIAGKFDITHAPAGPEGPKTHFHALGLGINKASDKQDEAKAFLAFLGSEDAMTMYTAEGGQPPVVDRIMQAVASDRPDMLAMGNNAANYGIVMNGGTTAEALGIYSNMAENFTAYWNDALDQDTAIANVEAYMKEALGK
ncbi:MAG: extracellular solute-binding protein [Hyphomicrobiales bacterium]|nr:extracellular solute-binding protein [Hyphomicrobiales bacterium]